MVRNLLNLPDATCENPFKSLQMMVFCALLLNVAVLVPVCGGLLFNAAWTRSAYGDDTPGRRILLSVYLTIGLASVLLMFHQQPLAVATLQAMQVVYTLTTPLTVGTFANPVVLSNLAIAAFHAATPETLWRNGSI
jgi:hypothetical protein